MGFFLIGRGAHDDVRLLSDALFATRQDAMAELSRLSARPEYAAWDAEVFVANLDAAAPVLLVRPQAAVVAEAPAALGEDLGSEVPEVSEQQGTVEAVEAIAAPEPEAAPAQPVEAQPVAGLAAGALAAGGVAAAGLAAVAAQHGAPEAPDATPEMLGGQDDLREALLRTTQHMAAEGVEPPASAGLVPATTDEPAEEEPSAPAADAKATETAGAAASDGSADAVTPSTDASERETPAWPWSDLDTTQVADEAAPAAQPSATEAAAPVAEQAAAVEEPDEAVIGQQDAPGTPRSTPREPMSTLMAAAPEWSAPEPSDEPGDEAAPESDFILDLEEIQPVQLESHEGGPASEAATAETSAAPEVGEAATPEAAQVATLEAEPPVEATAHENPAAEPDTSPSMTSLLTEYTCDDCVYVGTCPNRDQRLPKDCGSFQWR